MLIIPLLLLQQSPSSRRSVWLLLEKVNETKVPVRVTRLGKAIADVIPAAPDTENRNWLGSMSGRIEIAGDTVSRVIEIHDIEALKN